MATKSRGDENDPFAKPGGRKSWSGTAQPPPPAPPLPPGSPGAAEGHRHTAAPVPPGGTPTPPPIASAPVAAPPVTYGDPSPAGGSAPMYPPPPPTTNWGASSSKNWMGITSLVLGVTCIGAGLLGVIFGHLGLAACRRGEANNRGLALAGVIVNYSMIGLGLVGFAVAAATGGDGRSATPTHTSGFASQSADPTLGVDPAAEPTAAPTSDAAATHPLDTSLATSHYWYDLKIGDCVSSFYATEPDENGDYPFQDPTVVPCSGPHYGEVYALALIGGLEAPDNAVFEAHTAQLCEGSAFTDYVGVSDYFDSALYYDVLYPNPTAWNDDGREMVCVVVDESGSNTGSVRDSGL